MLSNSIKPFFINFSKLLIYGLTCSLFSSGLRYISYYSEFDRNHRVNIHGVIKINLFELKKNYSKIPDEILNMSPYYLNFTIKPLITFFGIKFIKDINVKSEMIKCSKTITFRHLLQIKNLELNDYAFIDYFNFSCFPYELKHFGEYNDLIDQLCYVNKTFKVNIEKPIIHYHKDIDFFISNEIFSILQKE